jgi:hypothetical protein
VPAVREYLIVNEKIQKNGQVEGKKKTWEDQRFIKEKTQAENVILCSREYEKKGT